MFKRASTTIQHDLFGDVWLKLSSSRTSYTHAKQQEAYTVVLRSAVCKASQNACESIFINVISNPILVA